VNSQSIQFDPGANVSRETFEKLQQFSALVLAESTRQNLIAASTAEDIWSRHVLDSLQLLQFGHGQTWLDLGTGAGFPGMIVAICGFERVILVEERRLRHEFLTNVAMLLELKNVDIVGDKLQRVATFTADNISARAFAPLDKILTLAHRFSDQKTRWILPKGRKAKEELASVRATWHGDFRLEPSVTDTTSSILIAENVSPRGRL
jgi:16S rRNA (guanine527-N7)-methyltransferase